MSDFTCEKPSRKGGLKSSHSFSHETLLLNLFGDLATSGLPIHQIDGETLSRRFSNEGLQFLYRRLKEISDTVLYTLENNVLPAESSFARLPGTRVPRFLGGLWSNIVDSTGSLLPDYQDSPFSLECVKALLQVGSSFSKYADSFPKEMIPQFLEEFVTTDQALDDVHFPSDLISAAADTITRIFGDFSLKDILPKHGPGAVATGERDEAKWEFKRLYNQLHQCYPYYEYFISGGASELSDRLPWYMHLTRLESGTAKVLVVPKTATSLRVISMEPLENQFIQQGQMDKLVRHIQNYPFTKGHVNFDDQMINRNQALVNSKTRELATIDLSSASDRLSLKLVESLFINVDDNVLRYLKASRSTHTTLPNGRVLELKKFAPMGSATCFPVQSIVFFALCVASISIEAKLPPRKVAQSVFVFGDDLIIPSEYLDCVAKSLESVGLKVNLNKSFSKGFFRESCGIFALNGVDITPIRFKTAFPRTRGDGRGIAAWISYAHACELRGYSNTAEYIYTTIEGLIGKLPYGLSSCGYFCRLAHSFEDLAFHYRKWPNRRWNEQWHRAEIRAFGVSSRKREIDFPNGWQRLLRDLLISYADSDPTKAVVARSARTKAAWHAIL